MRVTQFACIACISHHSVVVVRDFSRELLQSIVWTGGGLSDKCVCVATTTPMLCLVPRIDGCAMLNAHCTARSEHIILSVNVLVNSTASSSSCSVEQTRWLTRWVCVVCLKAWTNRICKASNADWMLLKICSYALLEDILTNVPWSSKELRYFPHSCFALAFLHCHSVISH